MLLAAIFGMGAAQAQFRFGVKAGLNLNSLHLSNLGDNFTTTIVAATLSAS